jgi:RND superfamily putative drug exporter
MIAALIPFSTSDLINLRVFGMGVALAVLLDVVLARPVLLPAAEAVLGRFGWWPTSTPHVKDTVDRKESRRRRPRVHTPRRPGHASQ